MTSTIQLPFWLVAVLLLATAAMALILWSIKRVRAPKLAQRPGTGSSPRATIEGLVRSTAVHGNRIELVQNGGFFDSLFIDIERATHSVHIETFLCKEGEVTRRLTELLLGRLAAGVEVRMLLDGAGAKTYGRADVGRLARAGGAVRMFHPFALKNLGRINQRTHRKIAIIDGRTGYIGGHCFVDSWLGDALDGTHARDISARIEGPVVNQLQSAFTENWIETTGEVLSGERYFPAAPAIAEDGRTAHVAYVSPFGSASAVKLLHYMAILEARHSITIQNPYFLPDSQARDALLAAVRRGVDVRIMIPSSAATDAKLVSHASHHHYGTLLAGGVRIFEYEHTLLHQKVFTIDGEWASIGSSNFDDRSFEINDEASLVVWDERLAQELESIFEADASKASEWDHERWSKRSWRHRLADGAAFLLRSQL